MATITARKVDDQDYALLSEAAEQHGRSISEELRLLIAEHVRKLRLQKQIERMREIRVSSRGLLGAHTDSVSLIRAVRDEE